MLAAHMSRSMLSVPACGLLTNMRLWSQPQLLLLMTLCSVSASGIFSVRSTPRKISSSMPEYLHGNPSTQRGLMSRQVPVWIRCGLSQTQQNIQLDSSE